ncbi:hypothetical protein ASE75_01440 [Sphingomonas sp. Leaf17]|nr:TPM domain-containing protein [Sphingomonas sp. Leaf17]KQM67625.1 hypothetical protein ASE75_01440 [Sphingomonas sp. Leaf17]
MTNALAPADHAAIAAAVAQAETGTNGEIVTIATERSDAYHDVALHYAIAAVLATTTLAALFPAWIDHLVGLARGGWATEHEPTIGFLALLIVQAAVFLLVRLLLSWMPLRLALTPRATKARRVRRRAVQYFKVGAERRTQARVGILLYVSRDEHVAEIVVDQAIHAAVPNAAWGEAMAALVDHLRDGRTADGMVAAIGRIGGVLAGQFPKTGDDLNELPDRLIEL